MCPVPGPLPKATVSVLLSALVLLDAEEYTLLGNVISVLLVAGPSRSGLEPAGFTSNSQNT